jgi:hypothetical protein
MRQASTAMVAAAASIVFAWSMFASAQEAPGMPTNVQAVQNGGNLSVAWNAPTTGGSATAYRLDFYSGSTVVASLTVSSATSATIPIPPGTQGTFTVRVTALNGSVPGPPSAPATFTLGGGSCPPPATPTGLTGTFVNGTATVRFNPVSGATNYILGAGTTQGASNLFNGSIGTLTSATASGLPPQFQAYLRVSSQNACGISAPTPDFFLGNTPSAPTVCVPTANTACAFNRFKIDVLFRDGAGRAGPAIINGRYSDGAEFYFLNPSNVDMLVQILNRCTSNNRYWIFASGLTNVEVQINVTDTMNGATKQYFNPLGQPFAPINDTSAFATCP